MIPYGKNGKIRGVWLAGEILSRGLVRFSGENISYDGRHHRIRGAEFSEEVKQDPEILLHFPEIVRDLLRLLRSSEEDPELRVPSDSLREKLSFLREGEDLTGMSFLLFFEKGLLTLTEIVPGAFLIRLCPELMTGLPDPDGTVKALLSLLLRFSGEEEAEPVLSVESLLLPAASESHGLEVHYEQEAGIERYVEAGLTTEEELNRTLSEGELSEGTGPDEATVSALETLSAMFQDMEEVNGSARLSGSGFRLTYEEKTVFAGETMAFPVPDGFSVREEPDGTVILWRPAPENPEEWEAASLLFRLERTEEEPGEEALTDRKGRTLRYRTVLGFPDGSRRITAELYGVDEKDQSSSDRLMREFLESIGPVSRSGEKG